MKITEQDISHIVSNAFKAAWENRSHTNTNSKRSAYFVSELANRIADHFGGKPLVQKTSIEGIKSPGEWLLDIAIVSKSKVCTPEFKDRESYIVEKIHWAIESEFSTSLNEFCKDFAKLLHIKSERYLYVSGLNQTSSYSRRFYINAQTNLAKSLVIQHDIKDPFFLAFLPTPGKSGPHNSIWDTFSLDELMSWVEVIDLNFERA